MDFKFQINNHEKDILLQLVKVLIAEANLDNKKFQKIQKKFSRKNGHVFRKDQIIHAYRHFVSTGDIQGDNNLIEQIVMKPTRTISGVTPVTVLTKPFPCPGTCIFCPNDIRMPKSYLRDEPGAQRAERNQFDPYLQTMSRLQAYKNIGHITDKVEIIILGGTWSFYPEEYQVWFIKRCFDALNDFGKGVDLREEVEKNYSKKEHVRLQHPSLNLSSKGREIKGEKIAKTYNQVIGELYTAPEKLLQLDDDQKASWRELLEVQKANETSDCRSVGLVIETRPDHISEQEVIRIRKLGCTKTQIGFQSLQDEVLEKNKRGHDVAATRRAVRLLRQAGFKIHAHWMPNLYGSDPNKDIEDFKKMFADPDFCPDELKIYPCSLISSAELMQYYQRGEWKPYTREELLKILVACFELTPSYCRLTRVIRDIPSTDIVVGNKQTNFREVVDAELKKLGKKVVEIRSREIRNKVIDAQTLQYSEVSYQTSVSEEKFLQFTTKDNKIVAFLRLSLPTMSNFQPELNDSAMIREVHVYGRSTGIGKSPELSTNGFDKAQHLGLGKQLIHKAKVIAKQKNYQKLQVISAVGTREYYRKQGFRDGELYQFIEL